MATSRALAMAEAEKAALGRIRMQRVERRIDAISGISKSSSFRRES